MIGRRGSPSADEDKKPKGFDDFELRLGDVMRGERATLGKSLLDVQRELKIKATYVAAIENCDISAFETRGFVAGYVRSYARYLGLDPEWAYARFCAEADFSVPHGLSIAASPRATAKLRESRDPIADPVAPFVPRPPALFSNIQPGAIGSVLVLVVLIGAIGYGAWSVLQEVQRVQLAPVDQAPNAVAALDPLAGIAPVAGDQTGALSVPAADGLDRLYRPQALDVPVLVARDGPISAIHPGSVGALAPAGGEGGSAVAAADPAAPATGDGADVRVVADAAPKVEIFAVRPAWVRVQAADGTVLFEKVLDAGERYAVPQTEAPAVLRAGNSGAVYFAINGKTYGPASPSSQLVKNLALDAADLKRNYALADLNRDPDLKQAVAMADAQSH